MEEIQEAIEEKEMKAGTQILEMVCIVRFYNVVKSVKGKSKGNYYFHFLLKNHGR